MRNMITMGEFIVKKQADYPTATGADDAAANHGEDCGNLL